MIRVALGARARTYRRQALEPRLLILRQLPVAGAGPVLLLLAVNLAMGLLPPAFIVATGVLVGRAPAAVRAGVGSPQWAGLLTTFASAAALFLLLQLLTPAHTALSEIMQHRVDGRFSRRLMTLALRPTGIGPLEDDATLARLREATELLETSFRTPGHAVAGTLAYVGRYTRLLAYCVAIGVVTSWWCGLLVFVSTMSFRYGQRGATMRMWSRLWALLGPERRERDYFRGVGMEAATAKEVRVFGLSSWAVERYRDRAFAALMPVWRERRKYMLYHFLWYTAAGLIVDGVVAALMVRSAAQGQLSLAGLTLGLQALIGAVLLGEYYAEADAHTQFGVAAMRGIEEFEHRLSAVSGTDLPATAALPETAAGGIEFRGVHFGYPGTSNPVFQGLDLKLRDGECTALVGLNGAGKTTLVKLLARLYDPDAGAVLVDGLDLRALPVEAWRSRIGVIFQDFNRYELSAADNIAFGAIDRPGSREAVRAVAAKVGLTATLDALPHGFDTLLSRRYEGGAELSGGQWQRVALARALYAVAAGARVLVLDEPTAALDVRAEAEFFDEFAELTRGVATLLVSHRFSSVRRADRIVVLEDGRVVEDGSHEQLLAEDGRYARLFRLQSSWITEESDDRPVG